MLDYHYVFPMIHFKTFMSSMLDYRDLGNHISTGFTFSFFPFTFSNKLRMWENFGMFLRKDTSSLIRWRTAYLSSCNQQICSTYWIQAWIIRREVCDVSGPISRRLFLHTGPLTDVRSIPLGSTGQFVSTQVPFNQMLLGKERSHPGKSETICHLPFQVVSSISFCGFFMKSFRFYLIWMWWSAWSLVSVVALLGWSCPSSWKKKSNKIFRTSLCLQLWRSSEKWKFERMCLRVLTLPQRKLSSFPTFNLTRFLGDGNTS